MKLQEVGLTGSSFVHSTFATLAKLEGCAADGEQTDFEEDLFSTSLMVLAHRPLRGVVSGFASWLLHRSQGNDSAFCG